ncbi:MAG: VOC family protein [Ignavibacteria bacterium]|nr:VOC family protein [Ignavibacteria bacterium]
MTGAIHHIEIYVSDLNKSVNFWEWLLTEKFSYTVYQKWDSGVSYIFGESYIVLVQTENKYLSNQYNRKNTGLNHLAFHCESKSFIDTLTAELKERNVNILYNDRHPYAGGEKYYAVFFEDPDRIKVEVVAEDK